MISRLISTLLVIWLAATLAFIALRILPGDAIQSALAQAGASEAVIEQRRTELGLDAPLTVQYLHFLGGLLRGDLGNSLLNGQPVTLLVLQRFSPTLALAAGALGVAVALGLFLGTCAARRLPWHLSSLAHFTINVMLSVPIYWTGTLAIYVFSSQLALLPSAGSGRLSQLVLPVAALGFHTAGAIARVTQANVREVANAEFVRTARAKGLPERRVVVHHILRVGLLPVVSVIALQAGFLLSGTVITEALFVRPGIGQLVLNATRDQDYPVVQGVVVLAAVTYSLVNAGADVVQRLLDPRVEL